MRTRRYEEEHENHERWLISYADFITLLFAFFVVMYSVSSVNEGKFRVLSSSMEDAFKENPMQGLEPVQIGEVLKTLQQQQKERTGDGILDDYRPPTGIDAETEGDKEIPEGYEAGEEIAKQLDKSTEKLKAAGFKVDLNEKWVEINMSSQVLFGSGRSRLNEKAKPILNQLVSVISEFKNPMKVEGFTDDRPIKTAAFPSNWELSAARAASVVSYFTDQKVEPRRMSAVGYGEYRPIADNSTAAGRNENRRIVIKISTDASELQADAVQQQQAAEEENAASTDQILHTIRRPAPEGFEE